jgi:uncharacterized protein
MEDVRITPLDPAGYRRTPWKNGGGVTVDIADAYQPGAAPGSWDGMIWRLGRTQIVTPGPFSDLAGYDRILTVIGGEGLVLEVENAPALDVRAPFRPVRFPGDWRIVSRLEAGPVAVLNLIAARGRAAINVTILSAPGRTSLPPGTHIVHASAGEARVACDGEIRALAADAALRIDVTRSAELDVGNGRVALASVQLA